MELQKSLQKNLRKSIYNANSAETEEQVWYEIESNLYFYEAIFRLRNNPNIQSDEWSSIIYALST